MNELWAWLIFGFYLLLLTVGCCWQVSLRRRRDADRRRDVSPLVDMTPPGWVSRTDAQLHMSILEVCQRQLDGDWPTPLDDNGRVAKVGVDFDRGGAA